MNNSIPRKDDKESQVVYLKETLNLVKKMIDDHCYVHSIGYSDAEVDCITSLDAKSIIDFIDKKLIDVSY